MSSGDAAKESPVKAVDMSDTIKDIAKHTLDGTWQAAMDTTNQVKDDAVSGDDHCEKTHQQRSNLRF